MSGTISPDVARAAVALHRSHPHAPVEVLDVCMRQRSGALDDFGPAACNPDQPFGAVLVEAFDGVMTPAEWAGMLNDVALDEQQRAGVLKVWQTHVLPRFADRYGLAG